MAGNPPLPSGVGGQFFAKRFRRVDHPQDEARIRQIEDFLSRFSPTQPDVQAASTVSDLFPTTPPPDDAALFGDVTGAEDQNLVSAVQGTLTPIVAPGDAGKVWDVDPTETLYELVRRLGNRAVLVSATGGDYPTLSAALSALTAATLSDPWLIVVSGAIAESAPLVGKSNVSVLFLPGAVVTIAATVTGAAYYGVTLDTLVNTTWAAADPDRPCIVLAGSGDTENIGLWCSGCDASVRLVGLGVQDSATAVTPGMAAHGLKVRLGNPEVIECRGYGVASANGIGYGLYVHNNCTSKLWRCVGTGGAGSSSGNHGIRVHDAAAELYDCDGFAGGGSAGAVANGIQVEGSGAARLYRCLGVGGSGGSNSNGIAVFPNVGVTVELVACVGRGGTKSGATTNHGISLTGGSCVLRGCVGEGGTGTDCYGISAKGQLNFELHGCQGRGGGTDVPGHGLVVDGATGIAFGGEYVGGNGGAGCGGLDVRNQGSLRAAGAVFAAGAGGTGCVGATAESVGLLDAAGCRFLGGGLALPFQGSYSYLGAAKKFQPDAAKPYRLTGGVYVNVTAATAGASVQFSDAAVAGNLLTDSQSLAATGLYYLPVKQAVVITAEFVYAQVSGGAPADGSFQVFYAGEWSFSGGNAVLLDSTAACRLTDCTYLSNSQSDAIQVTANGRARSRLFGGTAASGPRDVGSRSYALLSTAAWNPAPCFGMVLDGGSNGPVTCAAAAAVNGTCNEV